MSVAAFICRPIEGFHVTSQQPNRASHAIHSRHVGSFFALSGIGKSHKICSHSLLLYLHKAKLHRSNSVLNIFSLTASLTCSNKISKKLKHILLFLPGFSYTAPRKKYPTWRRHEVRTASWKPSIVLSRSWVTYVSVHTCAETTCACQPLLTHSWNNYLARLNTNFSPRVSYPVPYSQS